MEAKDDGAPTTACAGSKDGGESKGGGGGGGGAKDDSGADLSAPLAPALQLVAAHFAKRRAALGEDAEHYDGVECLYGDFIAENADEFDGWGATDGSGNGHDLKSLHDEYLELLTADVEAAVASSKFTLADFLSDVQAARRDGLSERWASLEAATGAWFNEALWAALDIEEFAVVMKAAADRQRAAMDRKRAIRILRRGAK